ncbi:MAG TPA: DUF2723 domain-containing protein, partial [Polyangiales bacterium]|nr:DUF2723 domain-containing protein [Polyangiales bacterium]
MGALAAYYVATMSRDLSLYDSGELALAAATLGLGHPPGQPLHALLGFLCSRLPFVNSAFGVNLASALPAALTLLPATSLAQTLTGHRADERSLAIVPWLLAVVATHVEIWEPASRAEVYAIATFFAVWAIACVMPLFVFARSPKRARAVVFRASIALGLSASANPMIAIVAALAITPALVHGVWKRELPWTLFPRALLGGAIGLLPYVYLPLTAADPDRFVWGGLHDRASYVRYLALRDYAHNQSIGRALWLEHVGLWFAWAARHLILPWLAFGLAGHARARYRIASAHLIAIGSFAILLAFISSNVIWHLDVPDYNGYMASAYWLLLAGAGAFFATMLSDDQPIAATAIALCTIATIAAAPAPWSRTRDRDRLARGLGEQVLHEAPRNAIVIALADHFAGTLFYLQEVEHARPDVVVLAYGLSGSSWHWEHVQRRHPDLKRAPLRGPGGRPGRVQRWLAANGGRPVLVEQLAIAR